MENKTKVVMLRTGTPNADPERSGPCVAIVVGDNSYLVDFGPGLVRRAAQAYRNGINQLKTSNLKKAFLTHLHSDHSGGYSDLILTPWVLERDTPLKVYGPKGLKDMTEYVLMAYSSDINERIYGLEQANKDGIKVIVNEITPEYKKIYTDSHVEVFSIPVIHGSFEAYGYKFVTQDKTIVVSGDTAPCDNLIKAAKGCDILIHEAYHTRGLQNRTPQWQKYHSSVHTSALQLGKIAFQINPKLLVIYHQIYMTDINTRIPHLDKKISQIESEMIADVKENFRGEVICAKDLKVYE